MASDRNHLYVVPNKNRLYVTVYPNDDAPNDKESFSWGFLIGPKNEDKVVNPGMRYYIDRMPRGTRNNPRDFRWRYAEVMLPNISCAERMYARILIAKIEDDDRLELLLRKTPRPPPPPPPPANEDNDPVAMALREGYGSEVWVAQVLEQLASMGKRKNRIVGTGVLDWQLIERTARRYVAVKMATDRYNEGYLKESGCLLPKPTWDMLLNKETTP